MSFLVKGLRRFSFIAALGFPALHNMYKENEISRFRPDRELKINDKVVPLPEKLQTLVDEVVKEMGKNTQEVPEVTAFICSGNDVKHTNRTWWSSHIFLGIPYHYIHDDTSQFSLLADGEEVIKEKPEQKLLKDSMCLSEEAKKYSIANALYEGIDEKSLFIMLLTPLIALKCNVASLMLDYLGKKIKKFNPPFRHHCIPYVCGIWALVTMNDLNTIRKEGQAAASPTNLGESYMKGGLEYYNKILERNKLIKTVDKRSPYKKDGEATQLPLTVCHMKLGTRLDYLKSINEGKETSLWKYVLFYF